MPQLLVDHAVMDGRALRRARLTHRKSSISSGVYPLLWINRICFNLAVSCSSPQDCHAVQVIVDDDIAHGPTHTVDFPLAPAPSNNNLTSFDMRFSS